MMLAFILALQGIALIAAGTPRQAAALSNHHLHETNRRTLRLSGFALLAISFGIAMIDSDRARHLIAWVGTTGIEAVIVALLFTAGNRSWRS